MQDQPVLKSDEERPHTGGTCCFLLVTYGHLSTWNYGMNNLINVIVISLVLIRNNVILTVIPNEIMFSYIHDDRDAPRQNRDPSVIDPRIITDS